MENILIIEDTDSLRDALATVLGCEGYSVTATPNAEEALEALTKNDFSIVLSDLKLPGIDGLEFIRQTKEIASRIPIVVMTAYGSIDVAVEAMKIGACDFITKPFDPDNLVNMLEQIIEHRRIINRTRGVSRRKQRVIVTQSPAMEAVLAQARRVAPLSSTVLILGESGTGKELLAQYIHDQSDRTDETFVAVNCASMPGDLLESEFFGHEAGSFTGATEMRKVLFEIADNGTIFLDEIGTMPTALQTKLLRTLQESEIKRIGSTTPQKVDVRVISATNCDLHEEIASHTFREDLYYRLGVVILEIPPLRERKEDIPLLANFFLKSIANEFERPAATLSAAALKAMNAYHWPGNVRELQNVIERALIFADSVIEPKHLELHQSRVGATATRASLPELASAAAKEAELKAIRQILQETEGNKTKAAKALGISYKTLLNKVKEYEL